MADDDLGFKALDLQQLKWHRTNNALDEWLVLDGIPSGELRVRCVYVELAPDGSEKLSGEDVGERNPSHCDLLGFTVPEEHRVAYHHYMTYIRCREARAELTWAELGGLATLKKLGLAHPPLSCCALPLAGPKHRPRM